MNRRNVHGDEIRFANYRRQCCTDCGFYLNLGVSRVGLAVGRFIDTDVLLKMVENEVSGLS